MILEGGLQKGGGSLGCVSRSAVDYVSGRRYWHVHGWIECSISWDDCPGIQTWEDEKIYVKLEERFSVLKSLHR